MKTEKRCGGGRGERLATTGMSSVWITGAGTSVSRAIGEAAHPEPTGKGEACAISTDARVTGDSMSGRAEALPTHGSGAPWSDPTFRRTRMSAVTPWVCDAAE